jgi:alpha-ketoglutarate-dependent taurine dioxygenase
MSARYGLDFLPLHTDGAHLDAPPDLVVLTADRATRVSTHLLHVTDDALPPEITDALKHGVFLVRDGANVRYATARRATGALRFDPVAMTPLDAYARRVVHYFEQAHECSEVHHWAGRDVLVIDNTSVVHGRASARDATNRLLRRVMLRSPQ